MRLEEWHNSRSFREVAKSRLASDQPTVRIIKGNTLCPLYTLAALLIFMLSIIVILPSVVDDVSLSDLFRSVVGCLALAYLLLLAVFRLFDIRVWVVFIADGYHIFEKPFSPLAKVRYIDFVNGRVCDQLHMRAESGFLGYLADIPSPGKRVWLRPRDSRELSRENQNSNG